MAKNIVSKQFLNAFETVSNGLKTEKIDKTVERLV